ncbi:MAG TPA: polyprenyl synthetase family protein [Acidimicrobiales bacterium]|nr:polyprenyl synthetase family protein [Acidimicrobiales bacterium]
MVKLEAVLAESVIFGDTYLDSVTTHLIHAGGKQIRPLLAVASATSGDRAATRDDLLGGVSLELMHLASLYHDDVMDEAVIRRNVDSVNARYGNLIAIVAGDYLMARSAGIAADLGAASASLMARTLAWLTRGQISEVRTAFSLQRTEADYFEAIEGKTAALMSASCRMGTMTANLSGEESEALTEFGRCFGMVYQLRDDILDLTATENQLSKPVGQDLAEGIYNLPTIYGLNDRSVGDELRQLLGRPLDDDDRERARKLVVATDGIDRTLLAAARFVVLAHEALSVVPSAGLRVGFSSLITSLLEDLPGN